MRIAIIGSGISGLVSAFLLSPEHDITIFESSHYIGGHTNTIDVMEDEQSIPVDTGFIVFNEWTYPNFIKILDYLGVAWQDSDMSFSVQCPERRLEYNGGSLNGLFAQRWNILYPRFHRFLAEILRFNKLCRQLAIGSENDVTPSVNDFVKKYRFSNYFRDNFLVPIGASIWSADPHTFLNDFPATYLCQFLHNHGMNRITGRPIWRVITGGSREYVKKLVVGFQDRIRLNCPIRSVKRRAEGVELTLENDERFDADAVIMAAHSDQSLRMLADPSPAEIDILDSIKFQENEAVLHTDISALPKRPRAWAAWNYKVVQEDSGRVAVTYNQNILQSLKTKKTYCVTLNETDAIDPKKIIRTIQYHHPVYTARTLRAQRRWAEISGHQHTYYAGAYWGFGFHEDGVNSALAVAKQFGITLDQHLQMGD